MSPCVAKSAVIRALADMLMILTQVRAGAFPWRGGCRGVRPKARRELSANDAMHLRNLHASDARASFPSTLECLRRAMASPPANPKKWPLHEMSPAGMRERTIAAP